MSKRSRILFVGNLILSTGLFSSLLAGRSNSHLVLPIVIVTCIACGLVYAVANVGMVREKMPIRQSERI